MPNYLTMPKKSQVLALLELGWSYRRIEAETGVRRETVSGYDRARGANPAKTFPGSDAGPSAETPGDQGEPGEVVAERHSAHPDDGHADTLLGHAGRKARPQWMLLSKAGRGRGPGGPTLLTSTRAQA